MNEEKVTEAWKIILQEIGEDVEREGIKATPKRVGRLYKNIFYGYNKKLAVMNEIERSQVVEGDIIPITVFKAESNGMLIRDTKFNSHCEHHIVPFTGKAFVGIIPNGKLLGMNKIDKIVKYFSARLQIQERLTNQVAEWIWQNIQPEGVIVMIKADHFCAKLQGDDGEFITTEVRGVFENNKDGCKDEFLSNIKLK